MFFLEGLEEPIWTGPLDEVWAMHSVHCINLTAQPVSKWISECPAAHSSHVAGAGWVTRVTPGPKAHSGLESNSFRSLQTIRITYHYHFIKIKKIF